LGAENIAPQTSIHISIMYLVALHYRYRYVMLFCC